MSGTFTVYVLPPEPACPCGPRYCDPGCHDCIHVRRCPARVAQDAREAELARKLRAL